MSQSGVVTSPPQTITAKLAVKIQVRPIILIQTNDKRKNVAEDRVLEFMTLQTSQLTDRKNNFNLLRIAAAIAVLFSHAYPLSHGPDAPEPLARTIGASLGT